MNKSQTITIANQRFSIMPEKQYKVLLQDIEDLKKVLKRRNEPGMEAYAFFDKQKNYSKKK